MTTGTQQVFRAQLILHDKVRGEDYSEPPSTRPARTAQSTI